MSLNLGNDLMKNGKARHSVADKSIVTAAITGSRIMRDIAPYIPYTPEEIVQSSINYWNAGAAIVHIHVRNPKTGLEVIGVAS